MSSWTTTEAKVSQGSVLGQLFFLIYVNDLSDDLVSSSELFADDTPLFSEVLNMTISAKDLHNDLAKIITWTFQRKISFNLDCTKQTQKFIFSEKIQNTNDTCLIFNHKTAGLIESQKYLGIVFDFQLDFKEHLEIIFKKVSKTMGLLHKLYKLFSRK